MIVDELGVGEFITWKMVNEGITVMCGAQVRFWVRMKS